MDLRLLAALLCFLALPLAAHGQADRVRGQSPELSDMQGHLILGPTFVSFDSVPSFGGIIGLGGTAHQRSIMFDVQLLYAYGVPEAEENFSGTGFLFGIGYEPVQTFRTRVYLLGSAGWAAVGVNAAESSSGPIIAPGVGLDYVLSDSPGTRWGVLGVRVSYHQYFQDPRGGVFLSISIGQAFSSQPGKGCNCSGI